jgi:thioredoxin 1
VVVALGVFACSSSGSGAAAPQATPQGEGAAAGLPRLVFFMNPHGAPCKTQDEVLRGMGPELTGKVTVVYVRTTASEEVPLFERFGVRSLPQLLLVDGAGRELRRATPGIQPADAIRRLVGI